MSPTILQAQKQIRTSGRNARKALSDDERARASATIADIVTRAPWFQRCKNVACYIGTNYEVDTSAIIARAWRMKKRVFAPVLKNNLIMEFRELNAESTLESDRMGIYAPISGDTISPRELDVVITPLVAFDSSRNRIGMGGGYFDRTFSFLRGREHLFHPKLIGVAFACQRVQQIVPNPWDIRLFSIVSDSLQQPR